MGSFALNTISLPWWGYAVLVLVLTHITIVAVTVYLHRNQAHRALDLHPAVAHFFRFWLWMTTGMVTKEWVAIHRKHHAKCESDEDPHSPTKLGLTNVLFGGVYYYVRESKKKDVILRYGKLTPDDWIEQKLYTPYSKIGVWLLLLIEVVLFGFPGLAVWLIQMAWIPFWAAGVINGIGHALGYRNSDTPDASTNIVPFAFWIGGEELHNNHHAYPSSARFSLRPYEFDLGYLYIRVLEFLGLAVIKKLPPMLERSRCHVDPRTIAFLRADNGYVRNRYRKVLLNFVRQELPGSDGEVRVHLLLVERLLCKSSWDSDPLPECEKRIRSLDGTKSVLPSLGKFMELLREIQTPYSVTPTTPKREESLVQELDQWVKNVSTYSRPRIDAFVKMLVASVVVQDTSR